MTDKSEITIDRIYGTLFGVALGDAYGLPAEGKSIEILDRRYPVSATEPHRMPFPYQESKALRGFPANDWTDDTDQTVLVMRALAAKDPVRTLARGLFDWIKCGFPELKDESGNGCGRGTWRVAHDTQFLTDPIKVAAAHAAENPDAAAGNGALMRCSPCAFVANWQEMTLNLCKVTHADPRCVASCLVQNYLIRGLVSGDKARATWIIDAVKLATATVAMSDKMRSEFIVAVAKTKTLAEINLGDRDSMGYTLKALRCSIWAFRQLLQTGWDDAAAAQRPQAALFQKCCSAIAECGGDADTNCAIAGAILGAALGYQNLPAKWLAGPPNTAWLHTELKKFIAGALASPTLTPHPEKPRDGGPKSVDPGSPDRSQ